MEHVKKLGEERTAVNNSSKRKKVQNKQAVKSCEIYKTDIWLNEASLEKGVNETWLTAKITT